MSLRVLVTAGASGIGEAIAGAFLSSGASVWTCDIDEARLAALKSRQAAIGTARADLGEAADVRRFVAQAAQAMGGVDVLVNNAGIGGPRAPVEAIGDEDWERTLRVNLSGAFYAVRSVVPLLKAQSSGCILNISTSSVRTGLPLRLPYVASKAGLMGLTANLARELGPFGIRCNAILPGSIANERGDALLRAAAEREQISCEQALERRVQFISMRSRVEPAEVAAMAVFLASPAARHVSGQFIGVCGNVEWEG